MPRLPFRTLMILLVTVLVVAACSGTTTPTKDVSASSYLPNLPGYTVTNVTDIQSTITQIGQLTSLGAGQPEVTALLTGFNNVATCYQNAGAIEARTYLSTTTLTNLGVVVVVNKNLMTDPNLFLNCTLGGIRRQAPQSGPQPCYRKCTINQDNNQFFVAYAATSQDVCSAFDASLATWSCQ